ncbi:unnamed protein product [Effrenium voratum]|nr:unnamed protein product [Effrenium voratum]
MLQRRSSDVDDTGKKVCPALPIEHCHVHGIGYLFLPTRCGHKRSNASSSDQSQRPWLLVPCNLPGREGYSRATSRRTRRTTLDAVNICGRCAMQPRSVRWTVPKVSEIAEFFGLLSMPCTSRRIRGPGANKLRSGGAPELPHVEYTHSVPNNSQDEYWNHAVYLAGAIARDKKEGQVCSLSPRMRTRFTAAASRHCRGLVIDSREEES